LVPTHVLHVSNPLLSLLDIVVCIHQVGGDGLFLPETCGPDFFGFRWLNFEAFIFSRLLHKIVCSVLASNPLKLKLFVVLRLDVVPVFENIGLFAQVEVITGSIYGSRSAH